MQSFRSSFSLPTSLSPQRKNKHTTHRKPAEGVRLAFSGFLCRDLRRAVTLVEKGRRKLGPGRAAQGRCLREPMSRGFLGLQREVGSDRGKFTEMEDSQRGTRVHRGDPSSATTHARFIFFLHF